jgi:hypothetical protein
MLRYLYKYIFLTENMIAVFILGFDELTFQKQEKGKQIVSGFRIHIRLVAANEFASSASSPARPMKGDQ